MKLHASGEDYLESLVRTASAVARVSQYLGCFAHGGTGRQVDPKISISKRPILLSKAVETVRILLAKYTFAAHKIHPDSGKRRAG